VRESKLPASGSFLHHGAAVTCLAGAAAVACSAARDGSLRLWDLLRPETSSIALAGHRMTVAGVAFAAGERRAADLRLALEIDRLGVAWQAASC
jgi:hypothetical protein